MPDATGIMMTAAEHTAQQMEGTRAQMDNTDNTSLAATPDDEEFVDASSADASSADASSADASPDLGDLYQEAVRTTEEAIHRYECTHEEELRAMGARLRDEQDRLYGLIIGSLPAAVREAAALGRRVATVLAFEGCDKLDEFCYLYMLKGPYKHDQREEMALMGVKPLLPRLRRELARAGFRVFHAWQRATNENTLSVSW